MKKIIPIITLLMFTVSATAQKVVADKVIAVIGDKVILLSDVKNRLDDMKRNGMEIPENAQCFLMETLLSSKALSQQAIKDSLPLSDEEIEAELDLKVRQYAAQFGSITALEEVAGKSVFQLKEDSRDAVREQKLAEEMQKKIMENVKITPTEVHNYFNKIPKDSLPFYEAQVEVGQIVIFPKASREVEQLAKDELNEYRQSVIKGEKKFELLARTYSDDPGTKKDGGLFSFKRSENNVDPDFKATALKLKNPGDVSPVVKSSFGYHIIQLVSRSGDELTVRHILKIPIVTESEFKLAMDKLDTARSRLIAGTMTWGEAVARYSEDDYSKYTGGMITNPEDRSTFLTIDRFPDKDLVLMMKNLKLGEYSQPVKFTDYRQKEGVRVIFLKTQLGAHVENMKDDYSRIAQRALEEKKGEAMEKWINAKLPLYYLHVDPEYGSCTNINRWVQESAKVKW
ncbi:MAG: peptidylprolyl isomerase [Dinghuibacter sp.]|nr:peptidylprolyl isomerase [Dinghuibacter sp.]